MWSAKSSYAESEAAHFATFHVPHDQKESFFATNKVVAAASGCKISYVDKGGDLKLKLMGSHRERRIAAVYLFFRLSYDKSRRTFVGFDSSLLRNISPPIAHVVRVPDQYNHAVVKESLHARNNGRIAIFDRCSEFGCLIDLTRLDKEREITILSARKVQRDKMLTWITEVAESTMRRLPLVALGQAAPVVPAPSPAENATVRALVTMGYDAGRVLRAVASLSDKSNVEAAVVEVERIAGDAVESLMAAVGSKPDYKSELNQLAMATRRKVHYSTMPLADGSGHAVFLSTVIVAPEGSVSAAGKAAGKTLAEQAAARQALVELEKKLSISAARRDEPPDAFVCPITFEVMVDPVIASDGYTYERHAIVHWVYKKRKKTSPTTNADLESFALIPNYNLRSQISEWQQDMRA